MWILLWNDRCAVELVVFIIGENVVLFGINHGLHNVSAVITLCLENLANDVHDLWSNRRASHEDPLHNSSSDLLELHVDILNQLKGRFSKFIELWLEQVNEHVN